MKVLKIIGNILLDILIGIIGICFAFALYHYTSIKIMDNPYTNFFGYTYFNIKTGSMASTINIDDYVLVKITKDVHEDDIISYVSDKKEVVTHRIISINEDNTIIAKGDANDTEDQKVQPEQVIGKVIKIGKGYGVYLKVITNYKVLMPLLLAIICINLAFTNRKKDSEKNEKKLTKKMPKMKEGFVIEKNNEPMVEKSISEVLKEKEEKEKAKLEQEKNKNKKDKEEKIEDKITKEN